ncbi:MAG: undecaprenyl/decaprenyl-phosphate alpha-N-acetylglucosaminyl 1-phosphate transferase [Elusimicrobia bacterium]|nr:undecaprenyl/decaprenyl-phosphate alpha-N-acetylglucosaminyl 1-phosphate transferase [Elusimicrobiota bacterium]
MNFELYILVFGMSLFLTLLFVPIVGSFAIKFNAMDNPSGRKIHRKDIPLWGGVAIFIGIFGTVFIMKNVNSAFNALLTGNSGHIMRLLEGILVGSIVIMVLGMVDDVKGVAPTTKLLGQIITAMIVMQYGIKIKGLNIPFFSSYMEIPLYLVMIITVLWITGFINSVNLIDGIDGLASGVMAIATGIFFVITLYQINIQTEPMTVDRLKLASVISLAVCGSCIGFLKYNFPPAKIFLGDSGSLLLGFMAGVITITGILKTAGALTLFIPILIFGVPIFDAFISLVRRVFTRKPFMEADRDHIHHRLLYRRGWNVRKVIFRIYYVTLILGLLAVLITLL